MCVPGPDKDMNTDGPKDRKKMNDEEKKRDRLERNRYIAS